MQKIEEHKSLFGHLLSPKYIAAADVHVILMFKCSQVEAFMRGHQWWQKFVAPQNLVKSDVGDSNENERIFRGEFHFRWIFSDPTDTFLSSVFSQLPFVLTTFRIKTFANLI